MVGGRSDGASANEGSGVHRGSAQFFVEARGEDIAEVRNLLERSPENGGLPADRTGRGGTERPSAVAITTCREARAPEERGARLLELSDQPVGVADVSAPSGLRAGQQRLRRSHVRGEEDTRREGRGGGARAPPTVRHCGYSGSMSLFMAVSRGSFVRAWRRVQDSGAVDAHIASRHARAMQRRIAPAFEAAHQHVVPVLQDASWSFYLARECD